LTAPLDSTISGSAIGNNTNINGPNVMNHISNAIRPNSNTKYEGSPLPPQPQFNSGTPQQATEQSTALHSCKWTLLFLSSKVIGIRFNFFFYFA
jgi:hypothetical protein